MALPNPSMDFSPFDILTAAELDDLVENDQALAAGTGLNDSAVTTAKVNNGAITPAKKSLGFFAGTMAGSVFSSTGNKSVTGVGFTPKMVKFTIMPTSASNNNTYGTGVMTTTAQFMSTGSSSATPSGSRASSSAQCIGWVTSGSSTLTMKASYVSMNADGFTINVDTADGTFAVFYECYG